jgi:hypothetical protein
MRGGEYKVEVSGLSTFIDTQKGRQELLTDWRYLRVIDVNGVVVHATYCHSRDAPQEAALAVERSMRLNLESGGAFAPQTRA